MSNAAGGHLKLVVNPDTEEKPTADVDGGWLRVRTDGSQAQTAREVSVAALYPEIDSALVHINRLSLDCIALCRSAENAGRNFFDVDTAFQNLLPIIDELFVFRSAGHGFALLITAVGYAIRQRPSEIEPRSIQVLSRVLHRLHASPLMDDEEALELIDELAEENWLTSPAAFDRLADSYPND